jgi:hypothetical protein
MLSRIVKVEALGVARCKRQYLFAPRHTAVLRTLASSTVESQGHVCVYVHWNFVPCFMHTFHEARKMNTRGADPFLPCVFYLFKLLNKFQ